MIASEATAGRYYRTKGNVRVEFLGGGQPGCYACRDVARGSVIDTVPPTYELSPEHPDLANFVGLRREQLEVGIVSVPDEALEQLPAADSRMWVIDLVQKEQARRRAVAIPTEAEVGEETNGSTTNGHAEVVVVETPTAPSSDAVAPGAGEPVATRKGRPPGSRNRPKVETSTLSPFAERVRALLAVEDRDEELLLRRVEALALLSRTALDEADLRRRVALLDEVQTAVEEATARAAEVRARVLRVGFLLETLPGGA